MHDTLIIAVPTLVVLLGILPNRQDANLIRTEMRADFQGLRSEVLGPRQELGARIDLPTGKVMELTDRASHLEARIGK